MKNEEVHKMSDAELTETVGQLRKQIFDLRCQSVTEKLENPRQFGNLRKDVARVKTEIRKRELESEKSEA